MYATDATLNVTNGTITAGSISGTINGTVGGVAITDGTITGGSLNGGTFNGTVTLTGDNIKTAIDGVDISKAKVGSDTDSLTIGNLAANTKKISYADATGTTVDGKFTVKGAGAGIYVEDNAGNHVQITSSDVIASHSVQAQIISSGLNARMSDGNVVAQNGLYIGATNIVNPTKDNSKFSVNGTTGDTDLKGKLDVGGAATLADTLNVNGATTLESALEVKGSTTVGGNLTVNGEANFAQETTFANGIKTDTISEKTDGEGVTVDGVVLKDGGITATGNVTTTGDIQGANITATGALKGKTLGIGTNGSEFTVDETGNTKVGGTLDVTGATTLKDELQVYKKATFGNGTGLQTVIEGGNITAGGMLSSKSAKIGSVGIDNTGAITGVTSLTTVALNVTGEFTTGGNLTVNGDLTANGAINGKTISISYSGSIAGVNFETGGKLTATTGTIGGVSFAAGGSVSGINELTATTIKDGAGTIITNGNVKSNTANIGAIKIDNEIIEGSSANGLTIENVKIKDGVVSDVTSLTANSATIGVVNKLDNTGITVNDDKSIVLGTSKITNGKVEVSTNTSLANEALVLNETNKWTQAGGLVADKATVNGIALGTDSKGKATFTDEYGKITTIDGDKITTGTITADKLLIDKISLGKDGSENISIDKNGNVTTKGDVTVKGADDDTTVIGGAKATFGKDAANQTVIDKGTISANAKNINGQQAGLKFDENGLTVSGQNAKGKTSSFSFNAKTGANTFTGQDKTFTTINGSSVRSYNSATGAGHLNGATLNLWKDNDNSTYMTAGGATFNGAAGEKGGKTTTINGGTITTDTLNVDHINLGGEMVDKNGTTFGSNLSMDNQGNFSAAGGSFKVIGGSGEDKGAMTNTVGNTTLKTDKTGASMKFNNTAADGGGGVTSEVAVEANKATVAAGDKASFVANADNGGSATITGGTQTVTTTDKGTVFENTAHKNPFVENGATNTIINGNEITTGKITTDQLVITGQGDADGKGGSIAFGGNGTIKSDINDGTANGQNTSFETKLEGVNTKVTNGTTTTENKVTAEGNSNTVKQDDTHKSEFNQGFTSIGGVVTNGEIKVAQKLDGATGLLTNEVTDANGSSKLEQSGTGLEYTDSAKPDNATRINSSDVSIGSATNEKDRINLSDLGQIDNLDTELTARDEYKNNQTAVGGINAEAAIRREEVARLDGRINDVNDRVNKVGAMAAAIASLKSIGYDPQAPSEFSIGLGQYKGETGVAMGFFHYPNKNFMINVSLSTAGGETMGGIGATWRFGHKSPQKLLEEQREAQAKKELAAAEKYQAAAKLAKEAQERAEYAAKLARQAQVSADNAKAAADATQAKHFG